MNKAFKLQAIRRIAGLAVMLAAIGFSMAACSDDSGGSGGGGGGSGGGGSGGGTLTVTGIPAQYNGMYAEYLGEKAVNGNLLILSGGEPIMDGSSVALTIGVLISNGKVSLPMWEGIVGQMKRYSGNDTTNLVNSVSIKTTARSTDEILEAFFGNITFSNGSATISWNQNTWILEH